jgi:hypothetical protein
MTLRSILVLGTAVAIVACAAPPPTQQPLTHETFLARLEGGVWVSATKASGTDPPEYWRYEYVARNGRLFFSMPRWRARDPAPEYGATRKKDDNPIEITLRPGQFKYRYDYRGGPKECGAFADLEFSANGDLLTDTFCNGAQLMLFKRVR